MTYSLPTSSACKRTTIAINSGFRMLSAVNNPTDAVVDFCHAELMLRKSMCCHGVARRVSGTALFLQHFDPVWPNVHSRLLCQLSCLICRKPSSFWFKINSGPMFCHMSRLFSFRNRFPFIGGHSIPCSNFPILIFVQRWREFHSEDL